MITKAQKANAERIWQLDNALGSLPYNDAGQTPAAVLNLSIPCAALIHHEVVTGVKDSFEAVNDQAVADVERYIRKAVDYTEAKYGKGWYSDLARQLQLP